MMTLMDQFLWIVYPYITLTIFILGLFLRYNNDQRGWSSKSSELLEKRLLKWGSLLFHYGIIFAFLGHVSGILIPLSFYRMTNTPDELYHLIAAVMGGISGLAACAGLAILVFRRMVIKRIRITSSFSDILAVLLLVLVVFNGMLVTVLHSIDTSGFDYRANLAPWFRSVLIFTPKAFYMADVPSLFRLHVFFAFTFVALMPFTRMVHIISQPITYLARSFIVYRKRS